MYVVFSLKLANELVKRGYQLISTGINIKHPQYKVFNFKDTEDLRRTIAEVNSRITTNI